MLRSRIGFLKAAMSAGILVVGLTTAGQADIIVSGNITDAFGDNNGIADAGDAPGLLFDEARTGSGDSTAAATLNLNRSLDLVSGTNNQWASGLATGTPGTVTFTGIGLPFRVDTVATQIGLNIRYLGADGVFGGGDDQLVGSVSDSFTNTGTLEYVWRFAAPLTFNWDGLENNFRFELSGSTGAGVANMRFKSRPLAESPSGQGGVPLSVGGSFSAVPEPSSSLLTGLVAIGFLTRRRKQV